MTNKPEKNKSLISLEDQKSIIGFMRLIHARTKAGEDICMSCYVQKTLHIFNKYSLTKEEE